MCARQHNDLSDYCNTCGNPISPGTHRCPHCDSFDISVGGTIRQRQIDIGHENQSVAQAVARLDRELLISKKRGDDVLIVIHGHGSTGHGGQIRQGIRQHLGRSSNNPLFDSVLYGENMYSGSPHADKTKKSGLDLTTLDDWDRDNHGITIVIF